jgi:hypothetical protein
MNVIIAPCLLRYPDPQRKKMVKPSVDLIRTWATGVRCNGLKGIILHDCLPQSIISQFEHIWFEPVSHPIGISCNDWRFIAFRDWLEAHPNVNKVFCTDLFDVKVIGDPFGLITGDLIYAAREPSTCSSNRWFRKKWRSAFGSPIPPHMKDKPVLNAGIFGGHKTVVEGFCNKMSLQIQSCIATRSSSNVNMAVFNYILYGSNNVWAEGAPLHSIFKMYESRSDVFFAHK